MPDRLLLKCQTKLGRPPPDSADVSWLRICTRIKRHRTEFVIYPIHQAHSCCHGHVPRAWDVGESWHNRPDRRRQLHKKPKS
ncbi:hypothetical protein Trydic_g13390 [Trypoxylus dichotomus]